jgi:cbb3-type cytochrome oxidase maturation protein
MIWTAVLLLFFTLILGIASWLVFIWAVKDGQFDDIEGPKYRIFDEEDETNDSEAKKDTPEK